jgi:flagellar biosynthesis/type III secretory pathway M-ring protein FliF/YscJ|tara:strand:- start:81 stop:197 length:117 start_codon:yes stop_codon:yes gene_type:complete
MIEELKEKIVDKWNDMSVKTKLIGAAIIVVIVVAIIVG